MEAAGLTDLLKQEGDFTLFAPSDEALAGLAVKDINILKRTSPMFSLLHHIFIPAVLVLWQNLKCFFLFFCLKAKNLNK